ncbi:helix-turn-helix domain-containing protein [Paenibacillus zanthoxyli]|uniref:helix-turn-helix domain-containing protein n=1 Tax=Paenibacillus zanthoxyli TaxID=369399 RepID=UPI00046EE087|nr:helix-turn-helix domain-containing protein [Paenibacillus zanthoxyli]
MKSYQLSIIFSSIIIGVSLVIGCIVLANAIEQQKTNEKLDVSEPKETVLMDIKQAANYLNLSEEQVVDIIQSEEKTLQTMGSFSGGMFPYMKINEKIYISKNDLQKWINESTTERRQYINGIVTRQ